MLYYKSILIVRNYVLVIRQKDFNNFDISILDMMLLTTTKMEKLQKLMQQKTVIKFKNENVIPFSKQQCQ